jgi:hypothetical protein
VVGGPVAGVGQRMMTGVAKRMAGQFFKAVDDELTGAVVPITAAPSAAVAPAGEAFVAAPGAPAEAPRVFAGKAARPAAAAPDLQSALMGAAAGALLTIISILIGYRLGRRKG